jgi:hypothetical protein
MEMKKRIIGMGLVGLIALVSFLYFIAIPRVSVTGTGSVTAYPDEAEILFSVRSQDATAAKAAAENGVLTNAVYNSLAALGVNASSIKTVSYSLSPVRESYNYSDVVGYVAVDSMEVVVTGIENLPNVGRILDAVVQSGANQIDGIVFTFTDPNYNTLRAQAYHNAVEDANSQASAIVSGLGGVIIGVASVSTNYGYPIVPPPIPCANPSAPIACTSTGGTQQPTPITSGLQQVTATVNITYLYL